jgi:hypothetical protein
MHKNPYPLGKNLRELAIIVWRLTRDRDIARHFWRTVAACAAHNPRALRQVVMMSALYLHFGPFSKYVAEALERQMAERVSRWQHPYSPRERNVRTAEISSAG